MRDSRSSATQHVSTYHATIYYLSRDMLTVSRDKIEFKKWIACPLWATVGYDEHTCYTTIFSLMLETEKSSLKLIVTKFCKNCPSCDRVLKRGLGNLSSKHMVSVNNYCLQFSSSRAVFENSRVRFCNLPGYFLFNSLGYNLEISFVK